MDGYEDKLTVCFAGNPNVGKSTLFNRLTGMRQHTGNWTGKTVECAAGTLKYKDRTLTLVDLPGTYSLTTHSAEERAAGDFIKSGDADVTVIVCDATRLERNLILVLQTLSICSCAVVCVNLMDEAKRGGVSIDLPLLQNLLGVKVVGISAAKDKNCNSLIEAIIDVADTADDNKGEGAKYDAEDGEMLVNRAKEIASMTIKRKKDFYIGTLDRILTGKITAIPVMLLLFGLVLYITIIGANYPSEALSYLFSVIENKLIYFFGILKIPSVITDALVTGAFRCLSWVVSVMLPPMAIFFPLFTALEDLGYLPRVAFCLDNSFKRALACGKQSLTMCMGFGCNCVGITGCRIIDSERERKVAMLTNNFVPCNGRFPILISLISMFLVVNVPSRFSALASTGILLAFILLGIFMTFLVSKILSLTLLKGTPSAFTLELPPYRKPQFSKIIVRSIFDRTAFVLARACAVAAPCGLIIWILANLSVGASTPLEILSGFFDPFGKLMGLDGVILLAFILGTPANEIVFPIAVMTYIGGTSLVDISSISSLGEILRMNGWSIHTAVCMMIFSLFHWPCATALITVYKESKSFKFTILSALIPTAVGIGMCLLYTCAVRIMGL